MKLSRLRKTFLREIQHQRKDLSYKAFPMKKEEYYSPLVSTDELEWEGILCASSDDDAGLPGSDFDDSTIHDGGQF